MQKLDLEKEQIIKDRETKRNMEKSSAWNR